MIDRLDRKRIYVTVGVACLNWLIQSATARELLLSQKYEKEIFIYFIFLKIKNFQGTVFIIQDDVVTRLIALTKSKIIKTFLEI